MVWSLEHIIQKLILWAGVGCRKLMPAHFNGQVVKIPVFRYSKDKTQMQCLGVELSNYLGLPRVPTRQP